MKIIYFGSDSSLSQIPLVALIKSNHDVCAFVYDDVDNAFSVINSNSVQSIASDNLIPLIKIAGDYHKVIPQLKLYQADIILVSCYARLIPQSIIEIAKKGCFNIHPSLLPRFRGPIPLFWQFREGIEGFGVTIHRVTNEFDSGNIVAQKIVCMKDGIHRSDAMDKLAENSGELILDVLNNIESDDVTEIKQNNKTISYQSFPTKNDYVIDISWEAKRIFNFINAYKGKGVIFPCEVDGAVYNLIDAHSYQGMPYETSEQNMMMLSCGSGYIQCEVESNY